VHRNLKLLRALVLVVVLGGLIVLATRLHGAAAVVVWVIVLVGVFVAMFMIAGTAPTLRLDGVTKQVFAQWQAGHPDRRWIWVQQEIPDPKLYSKQDPALLGRITTDPPVLNGGSSDRVTFLGKVQVDGRDVLVMDRGRYDGSTGTVRNRITSVSVDTPGLIQPVCFYRRSGYQASGLYRSLALGRFSTGDAQFDARFQVDAENRPAARRLLSPDVTRFLCTDPRAERVGFSFEHGALSVWLTDKFDDTDAIAPMIDLMMALYDRIPAQVWTGIA
jgi:hypothetical protein